MKLTESQIAEIEKDIDNCNHSVRPVRFLYKGQNLNIDTGALRPKGINIMYQAVYWNMPKNAVEKVLRWLDGVKAVYS